MLSCSQCSSVRTKGVNGESKDVGKTMSIDREKLFVSFWHIALENLPVGAFVHRCLTAEDARRLIEDARRKGRLYGVSEDDLLAPYRRKALQNHQKLCEILSTHFQITLSLDDFIIGDVAEEEGLSSIFPLQAVILEENTKLMVITCAYTLPDDRDEAKKLEFAIAPDSVAFHLIEADTNHSVKG